jgi:hypothetical protein
MDVPVVTTGNPDLDDLLQDVESTRPEIELH